MGVNQMKSIVAVPTLALASFILAACGTVDDAYIDGGAQIPAFKAGGSDFSGYLAEGYSDLALYEDGLMFDRKSAQLYAGKAAQAASGGGVGLEDPRARAIGQPDLGELLAARHKISHALSDGAASFTPRLAARAQTSYDCWVEQVEENIQPDHIDECRNAFFDALRGISIPDAIEGHVLTVYFAFDSSELSDKAMADIDALANDLRSSHDLGMIVTGHTDTSGSNAYNEALSRRRAVAVRDYLRQTGLEVVENDNLKLDYQGESQPAVITPDGTPEQANRRTEIDAVIVHITEHHTTGY